MFYYILERKKQSYKSGPQHWILISIVTNKNSISSFITNKNKFEYKIIKGKESR